MRSLTRKIMGVTLALAASMAWIGAASAQGKAGSPRGEGGRGGEGAMISILQELDLSEQQREDLRGVLRENRQDQKETMSAFRGMDRTPENLRAFRQARQELRKRSKERIGTVLTDEQMATFEARIG